MRRILVALAFCLAISPVALPAQTNKPPKVKQHRVKGHKAPKVKKAKRNKIVRHGAN